MQSLSPGSLQRENKAVLACLLQWPKTAATCPDRSLLLILIPEEVSCLVHISPLLLPPAPFHQQKGMKRRVLAQGDVVQAHGMKFWNSTSSHLVTRFLVYWQYDLSRHICGYFSSLKVRRKNVTVRSILVTFLVMRCADGTKDSVLNWFWREIIRRLWASSIYVCLKSYFPEPGSFVFLVLISWQLS